MFRDMLVISSLLLTLSFVNAAPMPYYTRSFVQTPTSTVEQYLIVPDKNAPHRLPASQLHHYSDFQFPRQQLVYYHPEGHNQYSLHEMKKDHPIMQQMMKDLQMSEDAMAKEMLGTSTDLNVMEKLKRDDGIMAEMLGALKVVDVPTTTEDASKVFADAIVVADNEKEEEDEIPKIVVENSEMKNKLEDTEKNKDSLRATTIHPLMTQVIDIFAPQAQSNEEFVEMLKNNQISEEKMKRIANLIANVVQLRPDSNLEIIETTTARFAKTLNLEIVEETKSQPDIQLTLIEEVQEAELMTTNTSIATEQRQDANDFMGPVTAKESTTIKLESSTQNNMKTSRMELLRSMLIQSVGVIDQNLLLMQQQRTSAENFGFEVSQNDQNSDAKAERTNITETATTISQFERLETSTTMTQLETTTINKTEIADEESTTVQSIARLEDTTIFEISQRLTDMIEGAPQQFFEQSTADAPMSDTELSSSEESVNEPSENDTSSEESTATPQRENTRQGRVNSSPTIFLHNNRFYVVSGEPDFFANFDAYQNPRTPIFSLQELQPIRPIDKGTLVQRIEPFRVSAVQDKNYGEERNNMAGTQNDNERDNEPLKLQSSNNQDTRGDIIENVRSMEKTIIMKNMEQQRERQDQSEVKKQEQDRPSAGEGQCTESCMILLCVIESCARMWNNFQ
jgi:hypothetical protein